MSITLSDGTTSIPLPIDLYWADEDSWAPVQQSTQRTLSGALIVSAAALLFGRPISLEPIDSESAWMSRATLDQLKTWAATPLQVLRLTLRGVDRDVIFRHQDGAIDSTPIQQFNDVDAGDFYIVKVRFMEIEV